MRVSIHCISFAAFLIIISSCDAPVHAEPIAAPAQSKVIADDKKAECVTSFAEFVGELDKVFDTEHSIAPVQALFEKYFPIEGCGIDQVFDIARKSRYFDEAGKDQRIFSVSFDNQPYHPYSKLFVQITFDRASGNSEPPFVVIH